MTRTTLLTHLLFMLMVAAGCVPKATVVNERNTSPIGPAVRASAPQSPELAPLVITQTTRLLDVRPPLAYASGHLPNAINVQWSYFSQPGAKFKGNLDRDVNALSRRLARLGIGPSSEVIVIGLGPKGAGEEGRVAWMLQYLGVDNVKVAAADYFSARLTTAENPLIENAPLWEPRLKGSLSASHAELSEAMRPLVGRKPNERQRTMEASRLVVIDARSEREYLGLEGLGKDQALPDMNAINVEWVHFFTLDGRVNPAIVEELAAVGITSAQRIIAIDSGGVRSAAVAYALNEQGFKNAGSYQGGFDELAGSGQFKRIKSKKHRRHR